MISPPQLKTSRIFDGKFNIGAYAALLAVLGVFGFVVYLVSHGLRSDLRQRVMQREASSLMPLVQYQVNNVSLDEELGRDLESRLMLALLETSDIEGALAVQLFDAEGNSVFSLPAGLGLLELEGDVLRVMSSFEPMASFFENAVDEPRFYDLLDDVSSRSIAVTEVFVPMSYANRVGIVGVARYVFDGRETFEVLRSIDQDVLRQGGVAFGSGALLITIIFLFVMSRLKKAYRTLDRYAQKLELANVELESVARTAAIGSVASHLIHGLKNPLAGLQNYLEASGLEIDEDDREDAKEAGKRMQALINEVVEVIRSNVDGEAYDMDFDELLEALVAKGKVAAEKKSVVLTVENEGVGHLDSRIGNIVLLIGSNLIQNAVDASPKHGEVKIALSSNGRRFELLVSDTGPGFKQTMRDGLFSPVQSSKAGGAGIGLAISSQLAKQIGASIDVLSTGAVGSCLRLDVPI